ncbi:hypothetical protein EGW08_006379 [Elysia chlorotica]|uniref:KANSL3 helical domain-containing protein n=1 Tax=Elysia chlorotica TaxID=188477 RepID=A0A433TWA8_ELYCH|nr:hypothetical protein EGW08_006379 [Elysia chlorotica]
MAAAKESPPTPPQRFMTFSQRMSSDFNVVGIDHCYAKPWSSHPDASNARPLQTLFVERFSRQSTVDQQRAEDELIDVDGEETSTPVLYDVSKARAMMSDCDRHASLLRPDFSEAKEDWEDHFASVRTAWTVQQNRIFAKVMKVLQADRLARLSIVDTKNEPVQRRLQIDKASKRIRFAFGNIGWDKTLILWLHNLLLDKLRGQLLTSYLEVLQKLKAKIPLLIDRLIEGTSSNQGTLASESLAGLLKRNWDPVTPSINQQKLKKLPDNPLLLLIPGAPMSLNPTVNKRHKFWQNQLASMGKVINVVPINNNPNKLVVNCVESMVATTRSKILEMKGHLPGRPIVLIGWNVGAVVALQVSLIEAVHAVVCLGFPTMGISGNRGEVDDPIYNCKTPTYFVVGQHASTTNLDCLEDIREKLRVETGLLLVGGADDQLRMSRSKKRHSGLTQAMVDRCIMEEMLEFLGNTLFQVMVNPDNTEEPEVTKKQAKKRKPKDMSSTSGSQTVESLVKQPKKIRSMKMGNVGTPAFTGHALITGKKSAPRKRLAKVSAEARGTTQKPFMQLTLPVITSTSGAKPTASTLSEAAAIASAPELSTLLQSIKTTPEQGLVSSTKTTSGPFISSKISSSAATSLLVSSSSNAPTTTALTLSKFLASSSFLKCVPSSNLALGDPVAALDSKSNSDPLSDIDLEELSGKEDSPVKNPPQQIQQPQILIRTGPSSAPFSIPLTFSMASKVLKSGTTMKLTNSTSSSQQIQHLLTSSSISNAPPTINQSKKASACSSAVATNTSTDSVNSKSLISLDQMSQPSSNQAKSSSLISMSDMPKASVINIGTDMVYLKENPPSNSSAPGTVSIDLGQIASGNTSSAVKLPSSSRISLIPSVKHIPLSVPSSSSSSSLSSSPERASLSSPVPFSGGNIQVAALSKPQPRIAVSSPRVQLPNTTNVVQVSAPTILQTSSRFGLSGLRGSQLLSTLSSSTGIIRFKMASQTEGNNTGNKQSLHSTDETDGNAEPNNQTSDPFAKSSRLPAFIDLTDDSPPNLKLGKKTVTSLSGGQTLSLLSLKGTGKNILSSCLLTGDSSLTPKQGPLQMTITSSDTPLSSLEKYSPKTNMETTASNPVSDGNIQGASQELQKLIASQDKDSASQTENSNSACSSSPHTSSPLPSPSKSSTSPSAQSNISKSNKSSISYTATPKPVLTSVASTRTRRIKVPKQYDL